MEIGERIKKLREEKNLTHEQIAKSIKSTKQAIFKYENGVVTNIPMDKLIIIAKVLGRSPAYILGWENENSGVNNGIIGNQNNHNVISLDSKKIIHPIDSAILTICESLNEKQKGEVLAFATQLLSNKNGV